MVDLQAGLKRRLQVIYETALGFLNEEEARDLSCSIIPKRGRGKRGPDLHARGGKPPNKEAIRTRRSREPRIRFEFVRPLTEADIRSSDQRYFRPPRRCFLPATSPNPPSLFNRANTGKGPSDDHASRPLTHCCPSIL